MEIQTLLLLPQLIVDNMAEVCKASRFANILLLRSALGGLAPVKLMAWRKRRMCAFSQTAGRMGLS